MLTTTVIHDLSHLLNDLEQHLNLFDTKMSIPVCNQFSWVKNWATRYLADHDKLFICIHKAQQETVAYYSLYLKKITLGYELRFLGTGEPEDAEVCSEFQDFVVHPDYLQESLQLFSDQVRLIKRCYRISFDNILPDAICGQWLQTFKLACWPAAKYYTGKRYVLSLAQDEELQIKALPQSTLRRHARRFLQQTALSIHQCETIQDIPEYFEALVQLHNAQWQKRNKKGAFSSSAFRKFHHEFACDMLQKQKLVLFKLVQESVVIAVFYGFYHDSTLYYYQSGISANSPLPNTGIAIHLIAMRIARAHDCKFYDLMKGGDDSYKKSYVAPIQPVVSQSRTQPILAAGFALKELTIKSTQKIRSKIKQLFQQ